LLDGDTPVLPDLTAAQYGVVVGEWFGPDLARLFALGP